MIRSAVAFGVGLVLLGPECADAWYRRSVRTSMGHVFGVPVVRCADLALALVRLREEAGVVAYAAVIDADAPMLRAMRTAPRRWALVLGNEEKGISAQCREACGGGGVRIAMSPGVDSLSVVCAAAVLLNSFVEREHEEGGLKDDELAGRRVNRSNT